MKEQNVFRSTNPNAPGLVISTGDMPDMGGVQGQIDQLRNQVGAGQDYTQPGNPLTTVYAEYETAAAQVFASGVTTICDYGTKVRDTHNAVTVGASWGFRAPFTGRYAFVHFNLFTITNAWGAGEITESRLRVAGADARVISAWISPGTAQFVPVYGSIIYWLTAGQSASIRLHQTCGGNLALHNSALYNWIHIARVG